MVKKRGWKPSQPILCLLLRDSGYLNKHKHFSPKSLYYSFQKNIWDYHNYRDAEIINYKEGINWLLEKNLFIIRMGRFARYKVPIKHKNFVDYPFDNDNSDFLDVFLLNKCSYYISTLFGLDSLPTLFQKTGLYINYLPYIHTPFFTKCIVAPQKIISKKLESF